MLNGNKLAVFLVAACAAAFLAGIAHLFMLRFQAGDIYPPYSTLRADPLGAKAIYDSLDALPAREITRNYRPIERVTVPPHSTLLFTGVPAPSVRENVDVLVHFGWGKGGIDALGKLLDQGCRLVVTFAPLSEAPAPIKKREESEAKRKEAKKPDGESEEGISEHDQFSAKWGVALQYFKLPDGKTLGALNAARKSGDAEPVIAWRSVTFFTGLDPAWQTIYECNGHPVVIERASGNGTIVLCADSYFLSNEALGKHRAPAFLAWLAGKNSQVVFDEWHHGIADRTGVMTLARRHGMFPFFGALLVLGALFIWKNAAPLVPPRDDRETAAVLVGKDSSAGFVNLLRRNIEPRELPNECWRAWRQSFLHQNRVPPAGLARAESLATTPQRDVLATMRELASLLHKRTK